MTLFTKMEKILRRRIGGRGFDRRILIILFYVQNNFDMFFKYPNQNVQCTFRYMKFMLNGKFHKEDKKSI